MTPPTHAILRGQDMLPHLSQVRSNTPVYLQKIARQYGDLVEFALLPKMPVFFINHPDLVRQVLQDNNRAYNKNTIQYNSLATITGRGLLTADGDEWFRHRRMEQPVFVKPRMVDLDRIVIPAVQSSLERWLAADQVDVDREMMALTLEIVGKALFSIDLSTSAQKLTSAVMTCLDHIVHKARDIISLPDSMDFRFQRALRTLDDAVREIIEQRRQNGNSGNDMLAVLLRAQAESREQPLSDRQLRDEVITLLIAGHETVAAALTWCWYLLAKNPEAWQKMREEVDRVLGGRLPAGTDLPALVYTGQVFNEALRLYPPAWLITRRAVEEDSLRDARVPVGSMIVISPYVIHRHPDFWQEPEAFRPERFTDLTGGAPRYTYIPFGGGPRLCIGAPFAQVEGTLILAAVTQRLKFEWPAGANVIVDPLVTLRPRGGLPMKIKKL